MWCLPSQQGMTHWQIAPLLTLVFVSQWGHDIVTKASITEANKPQWASVSVFNVCTLVMLCNRISLALKTNADGKAIDSELWIQWIWVWSIKNISFNTLRLIQNGQNFYWQYFQITNNSRHQQLSTAWNVLKICIETDTVWCRCNAVNFLTNSHKRQPTACPLGWGIGCLSWILGAVSIRKAVLPAMAIPMLKIRRPNGRLIFNMEIAIRR